MEKVEKPRSIHTSETKILQIMPAVGWYALTLLDEGKEPVASRLACWALTEDKEGYRAVIGLDTWGGFVNECEDGSFIEYAYIPQATKRIRKG